MALGVAIERASASGKLSADSLSRTWAGYRRRLRARFNAWTSLERFEDNDPPDDSPNTVEEWAVYQEYRAILAEANWEDEPGLAIWASKRLKAFPPSFLKKVGTVTIFDLEGEASAIRRVLFFFEATAKIVRLTLPHDDHAALCEVFASASERRAKLKRRDYVEDRSEFDLLRPAGLRELESELFRNDSHQRPFRRNHAGLALIGAPKGEGQGQIVAREIRNKLVEGAAPEEILVCVRSWDDDVDVMVEVAEAWGLPVSHLGRTRALAREPAISALLTAMCLPLMDWEAAELIRLIRHGRFRPDWEPGSSAQSRSATASVLGALKVFRGRTSLRAAIEKKISESTDRIYFIKARDLVDRLILETEVVNQPGKWFDHVARIERLAGSLGLGESGDVALETFWNALNDHAAVAEVSGVGIQEYRDVVRVISELVAEIGIESTNVKPGTVVFTTVENAAGARASHVILANLSEGTFPTKSVVEGPEDSNDPSRVGDAFSKEMALFLSVIGAADQTLTLIYPCRDEKGQEILPAGFVDELMRRFDPATLKGFHEEYARFHPALIDQPDLALAPADARVRAVALACSQNDRRDLVSLASDPIHRDALEGSASAILLTSHRYSGRAFDRYDGRLENRAIARMLTKTFDSSYTFSPSQIESYLFCRFQFFMKFVLRSKRVEDRDEFDDDHTQKGTDIHRMLEDLETMRQPTDDLIELVDVVIKNEMRVELMSDTDSEVGRRTIVREIATRALRRYISQATLYEGVKPGETRPRRHVLEWHFGREAPFVIGEGSDALRLQGMIDRVDVLETKDGPGFRVIDYKTGAVPSAKEVKELEMVQLPIYALAVERLAGLDSDAKLLDLGYWDLRDKGYKTIRFDDWPEVRVRLEDILLDVVKQLRSGHFEINPRKTDCMRVCDFKSVCRIGQVRQANKSLEGKAS